METRQIEVLPLFTAAFIVGLQLASLFPGAQTFPFFLCFISGILTIYLLPPMGKIGWVPLIFTSIFLGALVYSLRLNEGSTVKLLHKFHDSQGKLTGTFVGEIKYSRRQGIGFFLEDCSLVVASQTMMVPGKIRCRVKTVDPLPEPGRRYYLVGTVKSYLHRNFPEMHSHTYSPTDQPLISPILGSLRHRLYSTICSLLSDRHQAFVTGILLGDTSSISRQDRELLQKVGISHLLAISGQHILILAFVFTSFLSWLGVPPLSRCFSTVSLLVFYALLTPGRASIWRAIIMYVCGVISMHSEASPGPIRPLSMAALILSIVQPEIVHHVGFQMSFLAVLGILVGSPPVERILCNFGIPEVISRYLAVSLAAGLSTLPLSGYYFGTISLVSFIANPVIIGAFGLILPLAMIQAIIGSIWFSGGLALSAPLSFILDGFWQIVQILSNFPFATLTWSGFSSPLVFIFYAALLFLVVQFSQVEHFPVKSPKAPKKSLPRLDSKIETKEKLESRSERSIQPFSNQELIDKLDQKLAKLRNRSLKSVGNIEYHSFPIKNLSLEGQTLFYRLDDLSRELLVKDPDRLMQAQIFSSGFLGTEILGKVLPHLAPPATPSDLTIEFRTKNRYLAFCLLAESFFRSKLPDKTKNNELISLISRARRVHDQGKSLIGKFMTDRYLSNIPDHLSHRKAVFQWTRDMIAWIEKTKLR